MTDLDKRDLAEMGPSCPGCGHPHASYAVEDGCLSCGCDLFNNVVGVLMGRALKIDPTFDAEGHLGVSVGSEPT